MVQVWGFWLAINLRFSWQRVARLSESSDAFVANATTCCFHVSVSLYYFGQRQLTSGEASRSVRAGFRPLAPRILECVTSPGPAEQ